MVAAGAVLASASAVYGTCMHLQSTGTLCSGLAFCSSGNVYCEGGYGGSVDTGCGREDQPSQSVERMCWKATSTITDACNPGYSGGQPSGCAPQSGVCCFVLSKTLHSRLGDYMVEPLGDKCECGSSGGGN